jgi:predicted DNA-binding antitoxin AbrB/MazE fold protein
MTTRFTAIFEDGLLRPTEPVTFEEGAAIDVIVVPSATESHDQRAKDILAEIAALPMEPGGREFAGRDHDQILYGERGAR